MSVRVAFVDCDRPPVTLPVGTALSEELNISNSPVLFGCRTGICGTCLIEVEGELSVLTPPDESEAELLGIIAEGNAKARLCCKLKAERDFALRYIGPG